MLSSTCARLEVQETVISSFTVPLCDIRSLTCQFYGDRPHINSFFYTAVDVKERRELSCLDSSTALIKTGNDSDDISVYNTGCKVKRCPLLMKMQPPPSKDENTCRYVL